MANSLAMRVVHSDESTDPDNQAWPPAVTDALPPLMPVQEGMEPLELGELPPSPDLRAESEVFSDQNMLSHVSPSPLPSSDEEVPGAALARNLQVWHCSLEFRDAGTAGNGPRAGTPEARRHYLWQKERGR